MNHLSKYDYVVFVIYFLVVSGYGYWVYHHKRKGEKADTKNNPQGLEIDRKMFKVTSAFTVASVQFAVY